MSKFMHLFGVAFVVFCLVSSMAVARAGDAPQHYKFTPAKVQAFIDSFPIVNAINEKLLENKAQPLMSLPKGLYDSYAEGESALMLVKEVATLKETYPEHYSLLQNNVTGEYASVEEWAMYGDRILIIAKASEDKTDTANHLSALSQHRRESHIAMEKGFDELRQKMGNAGILDEVEKNTAQILQKSMGVVTDVVTTYGDVTDEERELVAPYSDRIVAQLNITTSEDLETYRAANKNTIIK